MYPENPEGNRVIVGSWNMWFDIISDTTRTRTRNLFYPKRLWRIINNYTYTSIYVVHCSSQVTCIISIFLPAGWRLSHKVFWDQTGRPGCHHILQAPDDAQVDVPEASLSHQYEGHLRRARPQERLQSSQPHREFFTILPYLDSSSFDLDAVSISVSCQSCCLREYCCISRYHLIVHESVITLFQSYQFW